MEYRKQLLLLADLATEAMEEYHTGKTHELDPETLFGLVLMQNTTNYYRKYSFRKKESKKGDR